MDNGRPRRPLREEAHLLIVHMDGMRVPDVPAHPVERLHIGDRTQAHILQGVPFLIEGLTEMSVQLDIIVPRDLRRFAHQIGRH